MQWNKKKKKIFVIVVGSVMHSSLLTVDEGIVLFLLFSPIPSFLLRLCIFINIRRKLHLLRILNLILPGGFLLLNFELLDQICWNFMAFIIFYLNHFCKKITLNMRTGIFNTLFTPPMKFYKRAIFVEMLCMLFLKGSLLPMIKIE